MNISRTNTIGLDNEEIWVRVRRDIEYVQYDRARRMKHQKIKHIIDMRANLNASKIVQDEKNRVGCIKEACMRPEPVSRDTNMT